MATPVKDLSRSGIVRIESRPRKKLPHHRSKSLEFRWENFNALNHVNLGLPSSQVDVSGAGQITSTASPMRQMQLGLHFRF